MIIRIGATKSRLKITGKGPSTVTLIHGPRRSHQFNMELNRFANLTASPISNFARHSTMRIRTALHAYTL